MKLNSDFYFESFILLEFFEEIKGFVWLVNPPVKSVY